MQDEEEADAASADAASTAEPPSPAVAEPLALARRTLTTLVVAMA